MLGVVQASSSSGVDELTEVELDDLPAGCVVRSSACATAMSSIAWNTLLGSGACDICSNAQAEASSSHWLCNRGPILPSCLSRNLSFKTLHHMSANSSTGPNVFLRVDRAISSNLMVINSNQWIQTNLCQCSTNHPVGWGY